MMKNRIKPLCAALLFAGAVLLASCGGARLATDVDSDREMLRIFDADSRYTATDASNASPRTLDDLMDYPEGLSPDAEQELSQDPDTAEATAQPTTGEDAAVLPLLPIEETDGKSAGLDQPFDRSLPEETQDEATGKGGEEAPEKPLPETDAAPEKTAPSVESRYILNTNTKKFHRPSCSSVESIKPKNYAEGTDREAILRQGYSPCKRCNP